jgi:hypothetical protein
LATSMDLKEWVIEYVKNRDVFRKSIQSIEDKGTEVLVTYKSTIEHCVIEPVLGNVLPKLDDKKNIVVVTSNKKENLKTLIDNWQRLIGYPSLTIYFVNPKSSTEQKWVIRPHMHHKVADDDALKPGLQSMFSTVEEG